LTTLQKFYTKLESSKCDNVAEMQKLSVWGVIKWDAQFKKKDGSFIIGQNLRFLDTMTLKVFRFNN